MTTVKSYGIHYEDVENMTAGDLLSLSYRELNALIREAKRRKHHASNMVSWLEGLKKEKSLRYSEQEECT